MFKKIENERLLIALPLFLISLAILPFFLPKPADPKEASKFLDEQFWINKTFNEKKYDIVVYGDSRILRGVAPQVMNEVLINDRIFNFAFNGAGINGSIFKEIENQLDKKSKAKMIVLGINPNTISVRERALENHHYHGLRKTKKEQVIAIAYLNTFLYLWQAVKPSYFWESGQDLKELYYQEFHNNGWVASWTIPDNPEKQLEMYAEIFKKPLSSDSLATVVCQQVLKWKKKGIDVLAFRPPTTAKMNKLENQITGFDEKEFVRKFEKAGGVWFDFNIENYHSYDGSHLRKESAIKFSRDLAIKIHEYKKNKK